MHDFLVQLQIYKPNLSRQEKKLADYLQQHPDRASHANIAELSAITGVSTATISRFAKALGYPSFQALKMALVQSTPEPDHTLFAELSPADSVETLAHKICITYHADKFRLGCFNQSGRLDHPCKSVRPFWIGRQQSRGLGWLSQVFTNRYSGRLRGGLPYATDGCNTSYCCRCDDFDFPLRQRQRCNCFGRTGKKAKRTLNRHHRRSRLTLSQNGRCCLCCRG